MQLTDEPDAAARAPAGLSIICSIRQGVEDLLAASNAPSRQPPALLQRPAAPEAPVAGERMSVAYVLQALDEVRDPASVIVEEAPSSRPVIHQYLPIYEPETFYTMCSGGLGYSLPAAVGIAMARPEARVIALVGDGSAMYSIQALWSAAQFELPMTFVILNNRRYAALREFANIFGYDPTAPLEGTELPNIDFIGMARSLGVQAVRVASAEELRPALTRALREPKPVLVEIEIE